MGRSAIGARTRHSVRRAARAVAVFFGFLAALWLAACMSGSDATPPTAITPEVTAPAPTPLPSPTGPITLTYWEEDGNEAVVLLDALAAEFMQINPEIVIARQHHGYDQLRNQFRAAALAGEGPALVRAPGEFAGPFGELGIVQPLDELFSAEYLDQFLPGALDGATLLNELRGLPDNFGGHLLLLYNKALVSEVPSSTDAWVAQLQELTVAADGQFGLVYPIAESYWLVPWLAGYGSWPLDAQGRVLLDTAEMIEALWFAHDLKFLHQVMPENASYGAGFDLFSQGRAAYIIDGAWNLERYQGLGIDVGVGMLPTVSRTGLFAAPMATGRYWFISKDLVGAELDAAARFVEFMTSAEAQQRWLVDLDRLPSLKDAGIAEQLADDPFLAGRVAQLRVARGVPPALEMACAWQGIDAYLPAVMSEQLSPDSAGPQMQAEADACVEDMGGYLTPTQ